MLNYSKNIVLELYENAHIDLTPSEIVGYGVLLTGVHLLYKVALKNCDDNKFLIKRALETLALLFDTEEVQAIDTQPHVLHPLAGRC